MSVSRFAQKRVAITGAASGLGRALVTRRIRWRGHRFRIGRGGRMLPDDPAPGPASPPATGAPRPADKPVSPPN